MTAELQFTCAYLIMDALCAVLALVMMANVHNDSGSETEVRYFKLLLVAFLIFVVSDAVWAFLMFNGELRAPRFTLRSLTGSTRRQRLSPASSGSATAWPISTAPWCITARYALSRSFP